MNKLFVACAGSGKTTHLVKLAIEEKDKRVLFTTFTDENTIEINNKFYSELGHVPENVTIIPWFSFQLIHLIRPYQGKLISKRVSNIIMVNEQSGLKYTAKNGYPVYFSEDEISHYFNSDFSLYSDKIAKLSIKILTQDLLTINRLKRNFDVILIDEFQDMAGYDLEIVKYLINHGLKIFIACDPRQKTYSTHFSAKFKKYNNDKLLFIRENCNKVCVIDETTLNKSFRCPPNIIRFASSLFPEYNISGSHLSENGEMNVIRLSDLNKYIGEKPKAIQLRYDAREKDIIKLYKAKNMGLSKGLSFDHVILFPTDKMKAFIMGKKSDLDIMVKSKFYVAITRTKKSLAIVLDEKNYTAYDGVTFTKWRYEKDGDSN